MSYLNRLLSLTKQRSFFLFGARNTGKSTLIRKLFGGTETFWIDLLDPTKEDEYSRHPSQLTAEVLALGPKVTHVVIDEIQKIPKLLDVVHSLIESTKIKFILTGSSARKLKHGGANLLAGRAFVYHLFPFSVFELDEPIDLEKILQWGTLPSSLSQTSDEDRLKYLQAYTLTYLKEEVWMEHLVRKLEPFRRFLEVSAQSNGKIINFSNISRDVGVDEKTIKQYFSILEDTLVGFFLESFQHSFRKRLSLKPKFYYFDTGVVRALVRTLTVPLLPSTSAFGEAFEHLIILEVQRLTTYFYPEYRLSYFRTKDDVEVDLVVERPGQPTLFIEIKSNDSVRPEDLQSLERIAADFGECEAICFSRDQTPKKYGNITVYPWLKGLEVFFPPPDRRIASN